MEGDEVPGGGASRDRGAIQSERRMISYGSLSGIEKPVPFRCPMRYTGTGSTRICVADRPLRAAARRTGCLSLARRTKIQFADFVDDGSDLGREVREDLVQPCRFA